MTIDYLQMQDISIDDYINVMLRSGLAARRPVDDRGRIGKMIENSNLIVAAKDVVTMQIVGVARAVTDFSFCCYLSDLAVDRDYQGKGIGRRLMNETRRLAGEGAMCLLLSAPDSREFYRKIGMPQADNAFLFKRVR